MDLIRKMSPVEEELDFSERFRRAMEELGLSFVKLGQIPSLRPDLLPGDLVKESEKLQEDVSAVELPEFKEAIEKSLTVKLNLSYRG